MEKTSKQQKQTIKSVTKLNKIHLVSGPAAVLSSLSQFKSQDWCFKLQLQHLKKNYCQLKEKRNIQHHEKHYCQVSEQEESSTPQKEFMPGNGVLEYYQLSGGIKMDRRGPLSVPQ